MKAITIFFVLLLLSFTGQAQPDSLCAPKNAIAPRPLQFTENGLGFGADYERLITTDCKFSFILPVVVTFDIANTSRIYDRNTGNYSTGKPNAVFYTMPSFKYYPTGAWGKLKYGTGLSFVVGRGNTSVYVANIGGLNETEQVQSYSLTGIIWQNSLYYRISCRIFAGIDLGIGRTINVSVNGDTANEKTLVQGSFKIGYCF